MKNDDLVEWVRPNENFRRWFGKVIDTKLDDPSQVCIEWIISKNRTKTKWEPVTDLVLIDEFPVIEMPNKRRNKDFLVDIDYPATYNDWHMDGNCYANGAKEFVGYSTARPTAKIRIKLEQACKGCPVMIICRGEAVRTGSVGWWGGMDEPDRMTWARTLPLKESA